MIRMMAPTMARLQDMMAVYANANTLETCRKELEKVLDEWILFRVSTNLPLPVDH